MTSIIIAVDKDLPLPNGNPRAHSFAPLAPQLRALAVGDSFFMARATLTDVAGIQRFGERLGLKLKAFEVDDDEIYLLPGVRIWRVGDEPTAPMENITSPVETRTAAERKRLGLIVDLVKMCKEHGAEHLRFHLTRYSIERLKLIAIDNQVDPSTAFAISRDSKEVIDILVEHAKQAVLGEAGETLPPVVEGPPNFEESLRACPESPFNPVLLCKTFTPADIMVKLKACSWEQLHRMLKDFKLDPGGLMRHWVDKAKVERGILERAAEIASDKERSKAKIAPVKSRYWQLPDGSCQRLKTEAVAPSEGATPITEAVYKEWEAEQEL